ncbi:MAG: DUF58 domain-containing protein [Pseudomonadales bacterium]|nr:DUF58 domain-containing protein [Pseudomonadales bacterium]MDG1443531.1 DUF58 domain-containing protein [Pseudomonadales bacterium]
MAVESTRLGSVTRSNAFWRSDGFQKWLTKRLPPSNSVNLNQKNIFILPTRQGVYFALLIFFMVLAGINYQNSLVYGLAFLLSSLFMVSILHTFRNLSGLTLSAGKSDMVFVGQDAEFEVILSRKGQRTYEAILLGWDTDLMVNADLLGNTEITVKLFVKTKNRGLLNPGRLMVQTVYPVGLFRAWSWVDLDATTLVFPRPIDAGPVPAAESMADEGDMPQKQGVEDFHGLRDFEPGDSPRHISWKTYARTDELQVKEFSGFVDRRVWLDWDYFPGMDRENRLSRLCFWVLQVSKSRDEYGLRLPGLERSPANSATHRLQLLKDLAVFELQTEIEVGPLSGSKAKTQ